MFKELKQDLRKKIYASLFKNNFSLASHLKLTDLEFVQCSHLCLEVNEISAQVI